MLHVVGSYVETEMKGRGSDDQIFERDGDTFGGLLTFDAPGELSYFEGDGMNDQIPERYIGKITSSHSVRIRFRPIYAMGYLDNADG